MQYTFLETVAAQGDWDVTSAGVTARDGSAMCELASLRLRSEPARAQAEAHRAHLIDDVDLKADMLVVASRAERAALAALSPDTRWRVFTLTEAVYLGRSLQTGFDPARSRSITHYAQLLDAQRGMLVLPRPRRQRRYFAGWEQPHLLDIPDGHHLRRHAHARTLKRVQAETTELAHQLLQLGE